LKNLPLFIVIIACIWSGMLLGISFLEAPLKFQAPGISLALGLGIGRLVFHALNKIEIVFALWILALCFLVRPSGFIWSVFGIISAVLAVESLWLLPVLDERAQLIIEGKTPAPDSPHIYYVIGEALKVVLLIVLAWSTMKNIRYSKDPGLVNVCR
jgi:F0F1-type ATP synthase assembly protein I